MLHVNTRDNTEDCILHTKNNKILLRYFYYLRELRRRLMFSSAFVCLFVSRITQNNRFSQNSVESRHMGHGRND